MNILTLSTILALFAIRSCSASYPIIARQATVAVYVLSGDLNKGAPYPNYTLSIPETGVTIPISRFSLTPIQKARHLRKTLEIMKSMRLTTLNLTNSKPPGRVLHFPNRGVLPPAAALLPASQLHLHARRWHQGVCHGHV